MKESGYNYFVQDKDKVICMNGISGNVFAATNDVYNAIKDILHSPNKLSNDPEIVDYLYKLHFLIDDNMNEIEILKKRYNDALKSKSYHLIINPTLECNFRCWYCYESHNKGHMDIKTIERVKKFIDKTMRREDITHFHLSWFGGEPLLYFDEVMYPIAIYAQQKAIEYEKTFEHSMTSNGFRLTQEVIKKCVETELSSIQVTLDGNREHHNKTRNHNGTPSYDIILNNIINYCKVSKSNKIILRINYTNEVIKNDMQAVFTSIPEIIRPQIEVSFHRVWQTIGIEKSTIDVQNKIEALQTMKFATVQNAIYARYKGYVCYADSLNYININFDGSIYKCTANDYKKENRLGYVDKEGNLVLEKQQLLEQINNMANFENPLCLKCKRLAICGGFCFNRKMKFITKNEYKCLKSKMDADLDSFVRRYYNKRIENRQSIICPKTDKAIRNRAHLKNINH